MLGSMPMRSVSIYACEDDSPDANLTFYVGQYYRVSNIFMTMILFTVTSSEYLAHAIAGSCPYSIPCRPENILYRTPDEHSDIVIADFGM